MATQRIEVITGREARRRYSDEEKLGLVEAAFAPGVTRAEFARRAGVDQSLLYRWRRQMFGTLPRVLAFTPVTVLPDPVSAPAAASSGSEGASDAVMGVIEVEFAGGERMRITGAVDAAVVTAALAALRGRPA
jgi:transposase